MRLVEQDGQLVAVELERGVRVPCDALFAHPPQRQVELVAAAALELDEAGFVRVDPVRGETSVPGIYAAGDLTTGALRAPFPQVIELDLHYYLLIPDSRIGEPVIVAFRDWLLAEATRFQRTVRQHLATGRW